MNIIPKISIVMTAYNAQRYIEEAIQSILSQTFFDFEFIIVDDHSEDETSRRAASFQDPRIIFIQNERNEGQTKALNIGIRKSRAPYIARMDADDVAYPERLAVQYEFLENHPEIALVGSACLDIDQKGNPIRISNVPTDPLTIRCYLLGSGDLTSWCIAHPTVMARKSALEAVGLYDEKKSFHGYPQDYDLWKKISAKYSVANIGRPLLKYRILKNSDSRNFLDKADEYRYHITLQNVVFRLPDLNEREKISLVNMLEYRPQASKKAGDDTFKNFDRYFSLSLGNLSVSDKAEYFKDQMKLYYVPKLFLTNKRLALKEFFALIIRRPSHLFDAKLYRKIIKVMLESLLPSRYYQFFMKEVLSCR